MDTLRDYPIDIIGPLIIIAIMFGLAILAVSVYFSFWSGLIGDSSFGWWILFVFTLGLAPTILRTAWYLLSLTSGSPLRLTLWRPDQLLALFGLIMLVDHIAGLKVRRRKSTSPEKQ